MDYEVSDGLKEDSVVIEPKAIKKSAGAMVIFCFLVALYGAVSIKQMMDYIGRHGFSDMYTKLIAVSTIICSIALIISVILIIFVFIYENKVIAWYCMMMSLLLKILLLIGINGVFYLLYKSSGIKGYDVLLSRSSGGFIIFDILLIKYFTKKKILNYYDVSFVSSVTVKNIVMLLSIVLGILLFRI